MVNYTAENYKRKVTHTNYKHGDKKIKPKKIRGWLEKIIIHKDFFQVIKDDKGLVSGFLYADEKVLVRYVNENIAPIWYGSFSLIVFILIIITIFTSSDKEELNLMIYISLLLFFSMFLISFIYYFTMPKKECIFNREDGTITYPGFMWYKNITMPVKNIIFSMSAPSKNGGGAFLLQIVRPDKLYTGYLCSFGNVCYEELSFYLWYMDKNRPLPPGTAFDPYREKDFQRRKAEGFPKPIFPSDIPTPEATPEQQAERERIGGW